MCVGRSEEVSIRELAPQDERLFLEAMRASCDFHQPWIAPPCTHEAFVFYYEQSVVPTHFRYLVCAADGAIAGVINLNEIVRGSFQSAYLGYCAVVAYAGKGYMSAGLQCVFKEAFGPLGLHRLEANIQPENESSIAFVKRNGFRYEGLSPRYLKVDGDWRDHERWAVTAEEGFFQ